MNMNLLCLDLGTKTGWSFLNKDQIISGTIDFKNERFQGGGMRYLRFRDWLNGFSNRGLERVYFEEVRKHIGVDAAHAYGGFMATLTSWCEEQKIAYEGVPVGSIKKHATGRGNANKLEMIESMHLKGFKPVDDNEADALALLLLVKDKLDVSIESN